MSFKSFLVASMALLLAAFLDGTVASPGGATPLSECQVPAAAAANRSAVLKGVNSARRSAGLAPVSLSAAASGAAQAFACEISARRDIDHRGNDGSNSADRLARVGIRVRAVAENTAYGFNSPDKTMGQWLSSAGHRRNILMPNVTQIGVGQAAGDYPTWVLVLYKPR